MKITNHGLKNFHDHSKWIKNVKQLILSANNISTLVPILK